MSAGNLSDLLDALDRKIDGDAITAGEMISAMEDRGFGPLLVLPALLAMPPTGAIPGVPTLMAVINACICLQLLFGRQHPWVPRRLERLSISRARFFQARSAALPWARRIDRFLHPRLHVLTLPPAPRLIALCCLLLGLLMIPLELIPLAAGVPAAAILLLGLALSVRDGALVLVGLTVATTGLSLIWWLNS